MLSEDYSGPYLKKFAIPFFKGKISDWDTKRESILQILDRFKDNMVEGDQLTDYNSNRQYHFLLEGILMDDLIRVKNDFGIVLVLPLPINSDASSIHSICKRLLSAR